MQFLVSVPATTANIGPGYDVWGMSLALRNDFYCEILPGQSISYQPIKLRFADFAKEAAVGELPTRLPEGEDNLIYKSFDRVFETAAVKPPEVRIRSRLRVPFSRGLGSSSTAILAGLVIANEALRHIEKKAFSYDDLFRLAVEIEGHPDNVAPALYGGLVVSMRPRKSEDYTAVQLAFRAPIRVAGIIPHQTLSTELAREVVPEEVSTDTVAFHASRTALLTHLFAKEQWGEKDYDQLTMALEETIHQEQRAPLMRGMRQTFEHWRRLGCHGSYLSGAGTTLLGFWDIDANFDQVNLGAAMEEAGVSCSLFYPRIDQRGLFIEQV